MTPSSIIAAAAVALVAATATLYFDGARAVGLCPAVLSRRAIAVVHVGSSRSSAATIEIAPCCWLPWRATLAEVLRRQHGEHIAVAWTSDGAPLECAADAHSSVYVATDAAALWQWPPEEVGRTRTVWLPDATFDASEAPGAGEAPWEATARATETRARREATLETLSVSPPIFRVRSLLTDELMASLQVMCMACSSMHPMHACPCASG